MDEHLPECCVGKDDCNANPCQRCHACCICEQLRACEERVEEAMDRAWEKFSRDQFDAGYTVGYEAAMDDGWAEPGHIAEAVSAAAQRVMELPDLSDAGFTYSGLLHREVVIDAIRGES